MRGLLTYFLGCEYHSQVGLRSTIPLRKNPQNSIYRFKMLIFNKWKSTIHTLLTEWHSHLLNCATRVTSVLCHREASGHLTEGERNSEGLASTWATVPHITSITHMTQITSITHMTQITSITHMTQITSITHMTHITATYPINIPLLLNSNFVKTNAMDQYIANLLSIKMLLDKPSVNNLCTPW